MSKIISFGKTFLSLSLTLSLFAAFSIVGAHPLRQNAGKNVLHFATKIHARGMINVVEQDRARMQAMQQNVAHDKRSAPSVGITNAVITYTTQVGVGSPPTYYTLLLDVGSSNSWVKGSKYVRTRTSRWTGNTVSVPYGSGEFSGEEWIDTVMLAPDLVINAQSIGIAETSSGFSNVDSILGLGPVNLTKGTVENTLTVPTVSDNLASQGTIAQEILGVYFVPASEHNGGGTLTFGGYDGDVITSAVNYAPITTTYPSSVYWGIDQSITYGNATILLTTAGITDTGTTFILIASDGFERYQSATGGTLDSENTGLLMVTPAQYADLEPLTFHVGDTSYDLSPNAQIWPRALNAYIGGTSGGAYLVVANSGKASGSGVDFVNGMAFLERFYSVYDTPNGRVGFATTVYTESESN